MLKSSKYENGLVLVDKEKGWTSFDVLSVLKKYLHVNKIGHTGTLDKNATGLLVCLIGKSTTYQDYFKNEKKEYVGELVLGVSTNTEDLTGERIEYVDRDSYLKLYNNDVSALKNKIEEIIKSFKGDYSQIPPMYSNKKIDGERLISKARRNEEIDRKPCDLYIYDINLEGDIKEKNLSIYKLLSINIRVVCSKGTYIRTLCKDIGERLNIPCCMGDLRRYNTDGFDLKNALTLEQIKNKIEKGEDDFINIALYNRTSQIITFGKYDCIHQGHRKIIDEVVKKAKEMNIESSVLTFSCHPQSVLSNDSTIQNIISKEQRISYLKLYGIDNIMEFPFNEKTKDILGEDFVKNILIDQMKAKVIIVGDDCSFGKGGICKSSDLVEIGKKYGVEVIVINRVKINEVLNDEEINNLFDKGIIKSNDEFVSSSLIRTILNNNERNIAYKLIGHNIYGNSND